MNLSSVPSAQRALAGVATSLPAVGGSLLQGTGQQSVSSPSGESGDRFQWSKALALPAQTYQFASGTLSGLTSYARRCPAGGFQVNPHGIVMNPEWTRHFEPGSVAHRAQPLLAGASAILSLAAFSAELQEALATGSMRAHLAASLDLSLAIMSATQIIAPGIGGAVTLGLGAARLALSLAGE